jgi:hypothetical protein
MIGQRNAHGLELLRADADSPRRMSRAIGRS